MTLTPRSGILAAGNWLVDHTKLLDAWPPQDALANIIAESWGNGGSPYNILKNLSRLGAAWPLTGIGLVGADADGERILADCRAHAIDTAQLHTTPDAPTSYSDVMTDSRTGRRTFFHQRGANALLAPEHFDFTTQRATSARIFHIGYILLLDRLDEPVSSAETAPARPRICEVLRDARAAGLLTSLDCVSENSDRFRTIVRPALPDVDVLFVNDFEAGKLTGSDLCSTGKTDRSDVGKAVRAIAGFGVRRHVIFHAPDAACALSAEGTLHWQPSLRVPPSAIRGTAGAGDAFAAGVLYGLHEDWPIADSLRLGVCTAAACLGSPTCSDSIPSLQETLGLAETWGFRSLPPLA
ncbi:MAG: carbohydrate kinase family protein [Opitutaceae bacterium]|jgi:sugar/nucleoside kinase (ribokinase family)|nr:carbohydrate kinase family protein [Opitutaceae bacterium]